MVAAVQELAEGWTYEAISIGYPGVAGARGPRSEPGNLGSGWVGFNFAAAFDRPVRIINDAAMQALGNYDGGRMLFLGLGTGLGSALIADRVIVPLELGQLLYRAGRGWSMSWAGAACNGWARRPRRRVVCAMVPILLEAFLADYVVLGGGNAKHLTRLPPGARLGHNQTAFRGGFRLWTLEDVPTLAGDEEHHTPPADAGMATDLSPRGAEPLLVAYRALARSPGAGGVELYAPEPAEATQKSQLTARCGRCA